MVAKFICEVEDDIGGDFQPARVLYSGTCNGYLRSILAEYGEFRHILQKYVHLTDGLVTAMSYAKQRAEFYGDRPMVLIVDTDKLSGDLYYDGEYHTKGLNIGSFLVSKEPSEADGRFNHEDWQAIQRIADEVTQASKEEVQLE
jgi:hypothetical protein